MLALATALAVVCPGRLAAQTVGPRISPTQAVQATPTVTAGNATVARSPNNDVVRFTTTENIINWSTLDTATLDTTSAYVNFLPAGTQVQYLGPTGGFTVLNRIFPTASGGQYRGVAFEGTVSGTPLTSGPIGNIWFYSPGGILATGSAAFNVGALVLTSSNVETIGGGGNSIDFLGVTDPASQVIIQPGATINATSGNNYVAMVAPRVQQGGSVTADGSVAYVAAEQAQLTISNGLFDIAVTLGSEDANGVVHTGTTSGPASQAIVDGLGNVTNADAQAIYLVAIPKNTAMTMLVGGDLGYQPASSAARSPNGQIVLSAGAGVSASGSLSAPQVSIDKPAAGAPSGNVQLNGVAFRSDVSGYATDSIDALMDSGQTLSMQSDPLGAYSLSLEAGNHIDYGTLAGGFSSVAGNVSLRAGADQAIGGSIDINVSGGASIPSGSGHVNVGGALTADTSGRGRDDYGIIHENANSLIGEDATGGPITLTVVDGGSLIAGSLLLDASAQGGKGDLRSGSAVAGDIDFDLTSGLVDIAGSAVLNAGTLSAEQGETGAIAGTGSDSTGGNIAVNLAAGSLTAGELSLIADGVASSGGDQTVAQSNDATAGTIQFNVAGGSHSLDALSLSASATAGQSFDSSGRRGPGAASRGSAALSVANPTTGLSIGGDLFIRATTSGIVAAPVGNTIDLQVSAPGDGGGLFVGGTINLDASSGNGSVTAPTSAGNMLLAVDNSTLIFGSLALDANASPTGLPFVTDGYGVDFRGGTIDVRSTNGGSFSGGGASISADATGGAGVGGNGSGGSISLLAEGGSIIFEGSSFVTANGRGGVGGRAEDPSLKGTGTGGAVEFAVSGAAGSMSFGDLSVEADGAIFFDPESSVLAFEGDGGTGTAGLVRFNVDGGTFDATNVSVSASGFGGLGGELPPSSAGMMALSSDPLGVPAGSGGAGTGGTIEFNLNGGIATVASLSIDASGIGGDGAIGDIDLGTYGGRGGDAFGGSATFNATSGSLDVSGALTIAANGNTDDGIFGGGAGGDALGDRGGDGGDATGGVATLNLDGTASITAGSVIVSTDAFGGYGGSSFATFDALDNPVPAGAGGNGGAAQAGTATFNNTAGSIGFSLLTVQANGIGGFGGDSVGFLSGEADNLGGAGGAGAGGSATINLNQDDATNPAYSVAAQGFGGNGGSGLDSGAGGSASGGIATLNVNGGAVSLASLSIVASAFGGTGGLVDGVAGNGGAGGDATAGSAILDVSGAGASLVSDTVILLNADGFGGEGAAGANDLTGSGSGGSGGNAGHGGGGLIRVIARNGATLNLGFDDEMNARGLGGTGGAGGSAPISSAPGSGGAGGGATGGTIELTSTAGGILNVSGGGGDARLNAYATGGAGGNGGTGAGSTTASPGRNGGAQGGVVDISVDSVLSFDGNPFADVSARGFADTRPGARGADAIGGAISISVAAVGDLGATGTLTANAEAFGGIGSNGTGGSVAILNAGSFTVPSIVVAAGGSGGTGADSLIGGTGGVGQGGDVRLTSSSSFTGLGILDISAIGLGGDGGSNGSPGAVGGAGGSGLGGSATVELTGVGAALDAATNVTFDVRGTGGVGGAGRGDPTDSAAFGGSGDGGDGGNGTGGSISLAARGGASFVIPPSASSLTANGIGGVGGNGGDNFAASITPAGDGGAGGQGTGGSLSLIAEGATISADTISLAANGIGGFGGNGGAGSGPGAGFDACVAAGFTTCAGGVPGIAGGGAGGSITLLALEGSPGVISLGAASLEANAYTGVVGELGGTGGTIAITDTSIDPGGLIAFGSLSASALGTIAPAGDGFSMSGNSGPIAVAGDVSVDVTGNIAFDFSGTGQLVASGGILLDAGNNILVAHANNTVPTLSIDSAGIFRATAGGNFESLADSIVSSASDLSIRAEGNVTANDLRGFSNISVSAGRNATIKDAAVSGPAVVGSLAGGAIVTNGIRIVAGGDNDPTFERYDPNYHATITGNVTSTGQIQVIAGGNAVFAGGSSTISDNGLQVTTGDDIVVAAGALLEAAANPATAPDPADPFGDFNSLVLRAGSLNFAGRLTLAPVTPIASLIAAGEIRANGFSATLSGNAIDGSGGTLIADSIRADVSNAPANGIAQRDDNGLLSGACLEGNVCLGSISAFNRVEIGQQSNNDVIDLTVASGTVDANDILITTRRDIFLGTGGVGSTLDASNLFSLTSLEGNVDLQDTSTISGQILIGAAGSLLGNGVLSSPHDIGITVGQNINASVLATGGELTSVADVRGALEGAYSLPGSMVVGALSVGVGDIDYSAGGDLVFGSISVPGTNISLNAPQRVAIGFTDTAAGIDITAGSIELGSVSAADGINLAAADLVEFDQLRAGGPLTMSGAGILGGSATGGGVMATAIGSFSVDDLVANGALSVEAATISARSVEASGAADLTATAGNIAVTGSVNVGAGLTASAPGAIGFGDTSVGDDAAIMAGEAITLGDLTGGFLTLTAGGSIDAGSISGLRLESTGSRITLADLTIGSNALAQSGSTLLTSTSSDIAFASLDAARSVTIDSAGSLTFTTISAGGPLVATAAGPVGFTSVTGESVSIHSGSSIIGASIDAGADTPGDNSIDLEAGGLVNVGSIDAAEAVTLLSGGSLDVGTLNGGLLTVTSAGASTIGTATGIGLEVSAPSIAVDSATITSNAFASSGRIMLTATGGAATIGSANSARDTIISGASVTLGGGMIGGNLVLDATSGNVLANGPTTVGGGIALAATGDIGFGVLTAGGGSLLAEAGGAIGFTEAGASEGLTLLAGGAVTGESLRAGGSVAVNAGMIALGLVSGGGDVGLDAEGSLEFDTVEAGGALTLAGSRIAGNAAQGGEVVATTPGEFSVGRVGSGAGLTIEAGSVATDSLDAGGAVLVDAANGAAAIGSLASGGDASVAARSVTLGGGAVGGDLSLTATAGDVRVTGALPVGGGIALAATGDIGFGVLTAAGGSLLAEAGGAIGFTEAGASEGLTLLAGGAVTGESLRAGGSVAVNAGMITLGLVSGGGDVSLDAEGSLDFDTVEAGGALTLAGSRIAGNAAQGGEVVATTPGEFSVGRAGSGAGLTIEAGSVATDSLDAGGAVLVDAANGAAAIGSLASGDDASVAARSVTLGGGAVGGDLSLTATAGDVRVSGALPVGGGIALAASGDIGFGVLTAAGGSLLAEAGGAIGFTDAGASEGLTLLAGGAVTGESLRAGGSVAVNAGTIALGLVSGGGDVSLDAVGSLDFDMVEAGGALTLAGSRIAGNAAQGSEVVATTPGEFSVGRVGSGAGLTIDAGSIAADSLDAGGAVLVDAASGAATIGSLASGGDASVAARSVTLGGGTVGGDLSLTATAGDVRVTGALPVGGGIALAASGDIGFGVLTAAGGSLRAEAGGAIGFTEAGASGDLTLLAGGAVTGESLRAGGSVAVNAGTIALGLVSGGGDVGLDAEGSLEFDTVEAGGALTLAGSRIAGNAAQGSEVVATTAGEFSVGRVGSGADLTIEAGSVATDSLDAGGAVLVDAASGAATIGSLASGGDASVAARSVTLGGGTVGGDLSLTATAGDVRVTGALPVGGGIALAATGDIGFDVLTAAGGSLRAEAGGAIGFTDAGASEGLTLLAGGAVTGESLAAGGSVVVEGASGVALANVSGSGIALRSANGAIVISNDIASTSAVSDVIVSGAAIQIDDTNDVRITTLQATNGDVDVNAASAIVLGLVQSSGNIVVTSSGGSVAVGRAEAGLSAVTPAAASAGIGTASAVVGSPGAGSILIRSAGDTSLSGEAADFIDVASDGDTRISDSSAGTELILSSGGATEVSGLVGANGDILISSGGDIGVLGGGTLLAGGRLDLDAGGRFALDGVASGRSIALAASDLEIAAGSRLGSAATTELIEITSRGLPVALGGDGKADHFSISNAEFAGIHSGGDLTITGLATGTSDPEITVGELDVAVGSGSGSATDGNIGANGALRLNAAVEARIEGALTVNGAGPDTLVAISATDRIVLDTAGGNIGLLDGAGAPAGNLTISAPLVAAMSSAALSDIQGLSVAEIDARLAENDGVTREDGFFQAGNLTFAVQDGLFIQNSGTGTAFAERRGFRSDTLTIDGLAVTAPLAVSPSGARIVINGVVGGATGIDAIAPTVLNADFNGASTINGCLIADPASCAPAPQPPGDDPRDLIEEEILGDDPAMVEGSIEAPLIQIDDPSEYADDPLIDDPITGAGNEDLWTRDLECPSGSDAAECADGDGS